MRQGAGLAGASGVQLASQRNTSAHDDFFFLVNILLVIEITGYEDVISAAKPPI